LGLFLEDDKKVGCLVQASDRLIQPIFAPPTDRLTKPNLPIMHPIAQPQTNPRLRPLTPEDEPFLWEMLYEAIYIPPGHPKPPPEIIHQPELARYVQNWGSQTDRGFLAQDPTTLQPIGAIWLRFITAYGYIDKNTPELSIAVLPAYRNQGIGTVLMQHLLYDQITPVSLSVSRGNRAVNLYKRFGFAIVTEDKESIIMKRG
jgi:GNAT superfamily N-acetyltransferase